MVKGTLAFQVASFRQYLTRLAPVQDGSHVRLGLGAKESVRDNVRWNPVAAMSHELLPACAMSLTSQHQVGVSKPPSSTLHLCEQIHTSRFLRLRLSKASGPGRSRA